MKYEDYKIEPICAFANIGYRVTNLKTGNFDEFSDLLDCEAIIRAEIATGNCYMLNRRLYPV